MSRKAILDKLYQRAMSIESRDEKRALLFETDDGTILNIGGQRTEHPTLEAAQQAARESGVKDGNMLVFVFAEKEAGA